MLQHTLKIPQIRVETLIQAPVDRVFEVLTTSGGWNAWFTQATTIDLRVGGIVNFVWKNFGLEQRDIEDGGPILAIETNRCFSFSWQPGATRTVVTFMLEERPVGTALLLTESGHAWNDEDLHALVDCASGWGEALARLKVFLEYDIVFKNTA